jgi:hypothetical protein
VKLNTATRSAESESQSLAALGAAIDWLQRSIDEYPYGGTAERARSIIRGLQAIRARPSIDELIALIGEIAKTDQGLQEITNAKARISEAHKTFKA